MKFKKFAKMTLAVALVFGSAFASVGCDKKDGKTETVNESEQYRIYMLAKEAGVTNLTYEEWLQTVKGPKGDKGDTGESGEAGKDGQDGKDGKDGSTWLTGTVAPNAGVGKLGDFYFDTVAKKIYVKELNGWTLKTTIKDGVDGSTPSIEIGNNGNWFISGQDSGVSAKGQDGEKPVITIVDGYWYIDGVKTSNLAKGETGADGREVELKKTDTHIQWKYEGETIWKDLIALDLIRGEQGEVGNAGSEVEFRKGETHIEWKYNTEDDSAWRELVALDSLKGDAGDQGSTWITNEGNPTDLSVEGRIGDFYFDTENNDIYLMTLTGWELQVDLEKKEEVVVIEDGVTYTGQIMGKDFEVVVETITTKDRTYRNVKTLTVDGEDGIVLYRPSIVIDGKVAYLTLENLDITQTLILTDNNVLVPHVTEDELGLLKGVYKGYHGEYLTISETTFALASGDSYLKGTWDVTFGDLDSGYYVLQLSSGDKKFSVEVCYFDRSFNIEVSDFSGVYTLYNGLKLEYIASESKFVIYEEGYDNVINSTGLIKYSDDSTKAYLTYEVAAGPDGEVYKYGYVLNYLSGTIDQQGYSGVAPFIGEYINLSYFEESSQEYYLLNEDGQLELVREGQAVAYSNADSVVLVDLLESNIYVGLQSNDGPTGSCSFDDLPEVDYKGQIVFLGYNDELIKISVVDGFIVNLEIEEDNTVGLLGRRVINKEQLVVAINDSRAARIILRDDIDLDEGLTIDYQLNINLNGHVLKASGDTVGDGVFHVVNGGKLTIDGDGEVDGRNATEYAMAVWADGGEVVINSGVFHNYDAGEDDQYDLIYVKNGGSVVINGGVFISQTPRWTLNVNNKNGGSILVNAGKFYNMDPSKAYTDDNGAENNPVNYVSETSYVSKTSDNAGGYIYDVKIDDSYSIYSSIETNIKYIEDNYYNLQPGTDFGSVDDNYFYTYVGEVDPSYTVARLYITSNFYTADPIYFSMGNNNHIYKEPWKVEDGKLYVSSLILKQYAVNTATGRVNIVLYTRDVNSSYSPAPSDIILTINKYSNKDNYVDISDLGAYMGNHISSPQISLEKVDDKYEYVTDDGTNTIRFYLGDDESLKDVTAFTVKKITDVASGNKAISHGYTALDEIDGKYYLVFYPYYSDVGYDKDYEYKYNYSFVLSNGMYGNYDIHVTLNGQGQ